MNLSGGKWHNEYGYIRRDTGRREQGKAVFEFTLDTRHPMTLQAGPQCFLQPDRHGFSNGGNVPWIGRLIVPDDLHWPSFIIHDIICADDLHRIYVSPSLHGEYEPIAVSSKYAAWVMGVGLYAAGYTNRAYFATRAVRMFGPRWDKPDLG